MITMEDTARLVYPDRQQMLALIRARAEAGTGEYGDGVQERRSAASELTPDPTCIFVPVVG